MSTVTRSRPIGWQSGISSCVRLAAMMPAIRAVPMTSPFLAVAGEDHVEGLCRHRDGALGDGEALGDRLSPTSTMLAAPRLSRWVRRLRGHWLPILPPLSPQAGPPSRRRRRPRASGSRRRGYAPMPIAPQAAISAGVKMPLSPTRRRSFGTSGASRLADRQARLEGAEVAVVDADQPRVQFQRAVELGLVMHLEQHVHAESDARCPRWPWPRRR